MVRSIEWQLPQLARLLAAALLVALGFSASALSADEILVSDDFESGLDRWRLYPPELFEILTEPGTSNHPFRLDVRGRLAELYVDDMSEPVVTFDLFPNQRGSIGLEARPGGGEPVWVDDIRVSQLEPTASGSRPRDPAASGGTREAPAALDWAILGPFVPTGLDAEDVPTWLAVSSANRLDVWLNGDFRGTAAAERFIWPDYLTSEEHPGARIPVQFRAGQNELILRVHGRRFAGGGLFAALTGPAAGRPAQTTDPVGRAAALDREMGRLAAGRVLWPGFEPTKIPLAVYDGERTHLFRHPAPPEEFVAVSESGSAGHVYEGRHPAVTANTYTDIGGTMSATVMLDSSVEGGDLLQLAAVALHEAFHVFQRQQHPGWQANEADLFVYPSDDASLLALRRLETAALRRALATPDDAASACWARLALERRRQRFDALDEPFVAYERGTELNEGLAAYVQGRAEGRSDVDFPDDGFPAADVRRRAYSTGTALALLLDRFRPAWRTAFEAEDGHYLDEALADALEGEKAATCAIPPDAIAAARNVAARDVAALLAERTERQAEFDGLAGWRIVVQAAAGQPLWPQGFDPLNVERLDSGILHTRFLKLGNESGQLEAIDTAETDLEALTEGAGPHPLFNGVRRVIIANLAKPVVETGEDGISFRADGFSATFSGADVRWGREELVVQLPASD